MFLKNHFLAFFISIVFALNPMRAESVVWLIQRKDLLYTMFYTLSFISYIRYTESRKPHLFIITILCAALASLSKIQALTLPVLLLATDIIYKRKDWSWVILEKVILVYLMFSFEPVSSLTAFILFLFLIKSVVENTNNNHQGKVVRALKAIRGMPAFSNATFGLLLHYLFWLLQLFFLLNIIVEVVFMFKSGVELTHFYFILRSLIVMITIYYLFLLLFPLKIQWPKLMQLNNNFLKIFSRNTNRYIILSIVIVFVIVSLSSLYRIVFVNYFPTLFSPESVAYTFADKITLILYSFSYYLSKFLLPYNLNPVVLLPLKEGSGLPAHFYILPAVVLGLLVVLLVYVFVKKRAWLQNKIVLLGATYFLVNIGMVIHIFDMDTLVVVANRYTYNAYFGLILILGFVLSETLAMNKKHIKIVYTFLIAHLLVWAVYTYNYSGHWRNSEAFWSYALKQDNTNYYAYNGLGNHHKNTGNFFKAADYYTKAISLRPQLPYLYMSRAQMYIQTENYGAALQDYNIIIGLEPDNEEAFYKRASLYFMLVELDKCASDIDVSLKLVPNYAPSLHLKAILLFDLGKYTEAKEILDGIAPEKREKMYDNLYRDIVSRIRPE